MDLITIWTVDFLSFLANISGGFGMAIIVLTVIVRAFLWPLSESQQRSMKKMQALQPKMKAIQERYKNNPQMMQQKMMEFYKENKFNPMAGCLPLLIQMPIFIFLYSALISPQFIQVAGDSDFLFIKRLDTTLRGTTGRSFDGKFSASSHDAFTIYKNVKIFLGDELLENVKINSKNALKVQGDIVPGETLDLKISLDSLGLKYSQLEKVTAAQIDVQDRNTREVETVNFERHGDILAASVPTIKVASQINYDVLLLVALFGVTMVITQKVMMATNKNVKMDPNQEQMQKMMGNMMPIFLMVMFVMVPIPAGVLLYLVVSNFFQIIQTVVINKRMEQEDNSKKALGDDVDLSKAKTATIKETPKELEDKNAK